MKKLILLTFLPFLSCNNANSAAEQPTEMVTEKVAELNHQVACEAFSTSDLASILNWDATVIKSESMGHSEGKRSICRFGHKTDILWVRFGWKSEKAITNKVLETQFKGYLNNGENGITYESIDGNNILLGQKPADGVNPKLYIFRKRLDNKSEVTFELYSNELTKEEALSAFKSLSSKLS